MDNVAATTPAHPPGTQPPVDLTGRTLNDFRLLRRLGQGGMGQVYLAEQLSLKRKVALKILRADLASNALSLQRFKVEAESVARATHANIVQVYVHGEADGLHYMALEYVEGRNLRDFISKKGPPEVLLALSIMRQVAAALQRAAELGIIHRDIKPENILLTRKGEVKVADFGLSRSLAGDQVPLQITQSGVVMGTPLYMSPEQVEGKTIDARTDIYSFGVTCYYMMAGHPPFQGNGVFEVALKHVREEPRPLAEIRPDLPETFCAIIHKMMAKNPENRYQTCRELLRDFMLVRDSVAGVTGNQTRPDVSVELVPLALGDPGETRTPPSVSPVGKTTADSRIGDPRATQAMPRPRWVWATAVCTVGLALAGGLALAALQHFIPARASNDKPPPAVLPPDAKEIDAICYAQSPQKQEKALRDAVEMYLNPAGGSNAATQVVVGLCLNLGVFYLEQDRLDDADRFFTRLEAMQPRPYPTLGKLGHGIVLALRSRAAESNKILQTIFQDTPLKDPPNRPAATGPRRQLEPEWMVWGQNPQFRFWIAQALYYNEKNGQSLKDLPDWVIKWYRSLNRP
jgi:serine/threonine-protein kinase